MLESNKTTRPADQSLKAFLSVTYWRSLDITINYYPSESQLLWSMVNDHWSCTPVRCAVLFIAYIRVCYVRISPPESLSQPQPSTSKLLSANQRFDAVLGLCIPHFEIADERFTYRDSIFSQPDIIRNFIPQYPLQTNDTPIDYIDYRWWHLNNFPLVNSNLERRGRKLALLPSNDVTRTSCMHVN